MICVRVWPLLLLLLLLFLHLVILDHRSAFTFCRILIDWHSIFKAERVRRWLCFTNTRTRTHSQEKKRDCHRFDTFLWQLTIHNRCVHVELIWMIKKNDINCALPSVRVSCLISLSPHCNWLCEFKFQSELFIIVINWTIL